MKSIGTMNQIGAAIAGSIIAISITPAGTAIEDSRSATPLHIISAHIDAPINIGIADGIIPTIDGTIS